MTTHNTAEAAQYMRKLRAEHHGRPNPLLVIFEAMSTRYPNMHGEPDPAGARRRGAQPRSREGDAGHRHGCSETRLE